MLTTARPVLLTALLGASTLGFAAGPTDQPWDCVAGRGSPAKGKPRLKPGEVIALASKQAKKDGIDLSRFRQSSICFGEKQAHGEWTVFFDGRELRPGNYFLVWVRDDTGAAKYMPGE